MTENDSKKTDVFWADSLATEVMKRNARPVVKAGASPSGGKHVGNLFDVMKDYMVYKALVRKGAKASFILTHDDRDPLRTIPAKLPGIDGTLVSTEGEIENKMKDYIGHPYSTAPDPFGCHYTWSEHFSRVWENGIIASGIGENEIKFVSNEDLYKDGKFDTYFKLIFENLDLVRKVMSEFQESITPDYIPVLAICENCGKIIGKVKDFNIQERLVGYVCEEKDLAGKYKVLGCGHRGERSWRDCKLAWRFEWPAQWGILNVDFEAFGKDHAEGSWPSGQAIANKIYQIKPPLYHVYEFLLVNGGKMSARLGNIYIAQEILDIIEPEIFMYFYTKRSGKQRNLDIKNMHLLVDEFERLEKNYFGDTSDGSEQKTITMKREYESSMNKIPEKPPLRIDYQFASVISQLAPDIKSALRMLRDAGHITGHITPEEETQAAMRLSRAKNWVEKFAPENKIEIGLKESALNLLSEDQKTALKKLSRLLENDITRDDLHTAFYEIAKECGIESKDFFKAVYLAIINKTSGPRLAPFILAIGTTRVRDILENVK